MRAVRRLDAQSQLRARVTRALGAEWVLSQLSLGAKKKIMQLAALVAAQAAADAAVWQHGGYYVKMLRTQVELHVRTPPGAARGRGARMRACGGPA